MRFCFSFVNSWGRFRVGRTWSEKRRERRVIGEETNLENSLPFLLIFWYGWRRKWCTVCTDQCSGFDLSAESRVAHSSCWGLEGCSGSNGCEVNLELCVSLMKRREKVRSLDLDLDRVGDAVEGRNGDGVS